VPSPTQPISLSAGSGLHRSQLLSLDDAIRRGKDLGPVDPATRLRLMLNLQGRNAAELQALVGSGGHVAPSVYASRFGPDPAAVAAVEAVLRQRGMDPHWHPGAISMSVDADARAAESLFDTSVHNFVGPDGTRFRAPLAAVTVPPSLSSMVSAVTGFNTYPAIRYSTLVHGSGLTAADIAAIYDIGPLRSAGLDGSGLTVVFPENSAPIDSVLATYAQQNGLPAFNVTTKTDPAWGPVVDPSAQGFKGVDGETEMDVEIVHAIAPAAKEIVYAGAGGGADQVPILFQAIADAFPNASDPNVVVSSSLGINECEASQWQADEMMFDTAWMKMAGNGVTAYDASGDFGGFCAPGHRGVYPDVASPNVTTVGGTTVFQAADGGYGTESAWGDPVDQIGGGGGVSAMWPRPDWQNSVVNSRSNGKRQVPDVAGPADPISPWATEVLGVPSPGSGISPTPAPTAGDGTSAAAPFWAGITALLYQNLINKKLTHPGLIAPVLYSLAETLGTTANSPFHDITTGSNLSDQAVPGWDYATGWGTPDVARLADALETYQTSHPSRFTP
jgi:kumamolisin